MEIRDYTIALTSEDKLRVFFLQDHGTILKFVVQYYAKINGKWRAIMRADNAHGNPHYHFPHLHGGEHRLELFEDANASFTRALREMRLNFRAIKDNFLFSR